VLVTIPSDVARGVVARSVAALAKNSSSGLRTDRHRLLGYVENMSGYYCHDCGAVKPLFSTSGSTNLAIPCLGTVPFDPELARHCDEGIPFGALRKTPVGRALDEVARRVWDDLDAGRSAHPSEVRTPGTAASGRPSTCEPEPGKEPR
jgi:hypothetical protein